MNSLINRSILTAAVIIFSFLFFYPNVASRDFAVVFRDYYRDDAGNKVFVGTDQIKDFINDRENGLKLFFPKSECVPAASDKVPAERRCVLKVRFLTSARINEVTQAFPELLDEARTKLEPHAIERLFSFLTSDSYKKLAIPLGLDLQGGMRATFHADFDTYQRKLQEKNQPLIAELNQKLTNQNLPEKERQSLEFRLREVTNSMNLTETHKLELLQESKNVIDKRLAAQNLTEPEVRIQPASYSISVDMPGMGNSSEVLSRIKDTVTVEYRLVLDQKTDLLNREFDSYLKKIQDIYRQERIDEKDVEQIMQEVAAKAGIKPDDGKLFLYWRRGASQTSEYLPREFRMLGPVVMDGSDMAEAQANPDPNSGWYMISFSLNQQGAEKFGDLTTKNVGRRLAILWGDRVVSDPRINGPIVGGQGVIQGDFTQKNAVDVANVIREGALPLTLDIISVSFVGPSLGQESIVAGILSVVTSFILIIIFMLGYYRLSGEVAVFALFLNLLLMAAILSLMEFTLTLPGFAGVILTVGMAVDANVIIYEKMKEEQYLSKSLSVIIDSGFNDSFWTILDSNITTLIAAVVLYYQGDGPIKGFAITLFFGLLCSMFTSLFVSRLVFDWLMYFNIKKITLGWGNHPKGANV